MAMVLHGGWHGGRVRFILVVHDGSVGYGHHHHHDRDFGPWQRRFTLHVLAQIGSCCRSEAESSLPSSSAGVRSLLNGPDQEAASDHQGILNVSEITTRFKFRRRQSGHKVINTVSVTAIQVRKISLIAQRSFLGNACA